MSIDILAGRSSFGRSSFGSSFGSRSRSYTSRPRSYATRVRPNTSRNTNTVNSHNTIINHYSPTRVYGGHTYVFHSGGWGYGYYGVHPYFGSWYGYPMYYCQPWHWAGYDYAWGLGGTAVFIAVLIFLAGLVRGV